MKMRIVGMSDSLIWYQWLYKGTWLQRKTDYALFLEFVKKHFSHYYDILGDDVRGYYNFGVTEKMYIKGEAYIYE